MKVAMSVFAMTLVASGALSAATLERSAAADARGEVEIVNVSGIVRVIGWERAEVHVIAKTSAEEELEFNRDGARTTVRIVIPRGTRTKGTEVTVQVPRESRLIVNTVSADQSIEAVRGAQRLQSVSGDIRTQVWSGEFEAKSVSGDIAATGQSAQAPGRTRVSTVSGEMDLRNLSPDIELSTVSGDLQLRAESLAQARVRSTSGNVALTSALAKNAHVDVEAVSGELTFNIAGSLDAEFDIESLSGRIDNCFGPTPKRKSDRGPGMELRFKEGVGAARVRMRTLSGGVDLCRPQGSAKMQHREPRLAMRRPPIV